MWVVGGWGTGLGFEGGGGVRGRIVGWNGGRSWD